MKQYYVYVYRDPITQIPFYVGKGCGYRAFSHLTNSSNSRVRYKIAKLKQSLLVPSIEVIDCLDESHSFLLEECLIELFGRVNIGTGSLFNFTDGGEGMSGYVHSELAKTKIGNSSKQRHKNGHPTWYSNISTSKIGKTKENDVGRQKVAEKMIGNQRALSRKTTPKGKIWVTDGSTSRMVYENELTKLPGWRKGRIGWSNTTKH